MRTALLLVLCLAAASPGLPGQPLRTHPTTLVRIPTWSPEKEARLRLLLPHLDVVEALRPAYVQALVFLEDVAALRAAGFAPTVLQHDLEAFYAARLDGAAAQARGAALGRGSMGGYLTLGEVTALLDSWRAQYPNLITARQSIGKTVEGRDQWIVKVSDNADVDENEPELYLEALIHAREPGGMMSALRCLEYLLQHHGSDPAATDLLDNREIWCVPVMNADGYEYNRQTNPNGGGLWRKNRRVVGGSVQGVDLNRNFGFQWGYDNVGSSPTPSSSTYRGSGPFSEPEAQNVRDFINSRLGRGIVAAWDIHAYGGLCMWPWGYANLNSPRHASYAEMTADLVAHHHYTPGIINTTLYAINGGATDWFEGGAGLWGWLPELGEDFWPPTSRALALPEENLRMLLTAIQYAGPYLVTQRLTATEVGNGNGALEPGERLEVVVQVRNRGVATATGAAVELHAPTPFARLERGSAPLGDVAPFTSAGNAGAPLRAFIPDFTAPGTRLPLEVLFTFAGHTLRTPLEVVVGAPLILVDDPCEARTWTTGVPGDDAVRGLWTWGDPFETVADPSVQFVVQTGDDHSAGSARSCYVTGNQNTSNANADDVDAGKTTLVTPAFDLSTARNPYVEVWRWFMDHGSEPNNDVLRLAVTNDGGQTWIDVAAVDYSDPAWRRHSFRLRDFVDPTAQVQLRVVAADQPDDSHCEALIDDLRITDYDDGVRLTLSGSTGIGQTCNLDLRAARSGGRSYVAAVALGSRPGIALPSGRTIPLNPDPLLTSFALAPAVFQNFTGQLDAQGAAQARIAIPAMPGLIGATIFAAFVAIDGQAPEGIRDISAAAAVTFLP